MSISSFNLGDLPDVLGLPDGTSVAITGSTESAGFSNSSLAGFSGSIFNQFLVISTGLSSDVNGANTSGSQGTDLGTVGAGGDTFDTLTLNFVVPRPVSAASITFDFTFLSEEFPEFVGSEFNDFLSIKLDGTELALDTSGNPITVNNNFFNPSLNPSGTIFDGQTPPLRITAPLTGTSNTASLQIQIADVGDGIYDSAAFIDNFKIIEPQTIFVDFDGGTIDFGTIFLFLNQTVTLPASGLSVDQQNQIIANANAIYSDFLVEFTTTRPTQGQFSTILVGGDANDISGLTNNPATLLGRAEQLDFGNNDRSDNAFVLAGQSAFNPGGTPDIPLLSQTLAHEAGHILGLRHVLGENELMYPFANANSTNIGSEMSLAKINNGNVQAIDGLQNSREELSRNVGFRSSSELITSESIFDKILKFFELNLNSTASTIFDATIATVNAEGEVLEFYEVGDIAGDKSIEFITPATNEDIIVFLGKSDADGQFDIFLSPGGVASFDLSTTTDIDLIETLGIPVANFGSQLELVSADTNGNLTEIGTPETILLDIGSSEATEGDDVLVGTDEDNEIVGLAGNDIITGNAGDDVLFGNTGNDTLNGNAGSDILNGGEGDDIIEPESGIDDITLGTGSDTVRGTTSELNGDTIQDFEDEDQIIVLGATFANIEVTSAGEDTLLSFGSSSIILKGEFREEDFIVSTSGEDDDALTTISFNSAFGFSETSADGLFLFRGNTTLQTSVTQISTNKTNQLVAFEVDDAQGTINGVTSDSEDYLTAILESGRNNIILSTLASDNPSGLPDNFSVEGFSRFLDFTAGTRVGFMLIADGTLDELQAGQDRQVFFSNRNNAEVIDFLTESFNLNFQDQSGGTFDAFQVAIQALEFGSVEIVGTDLQSQEGLEVIDLRTQADDLNAQITVNSESAFSNFVDFYEVVDQLGGIDINGDGIADVNPRDDNYTQTAINQRIGLGILDGSSVFDTTLQAGGILAPFIITNGTPDNFVEAEVYFSFLGANSDGADHLILLGDNTFGFEDLPNGGDRDFDDMIIQVQFA